MSTTDDRGRLLLVHAHPDDESIGTGATMAKYAAEGAAVTLVTCTLGELGEIIQPELAHLAAGVDGGLGQHRIGELAEACAALGVTDHRFLGGAGRWHDSGMMGTASNDWDNSFWRADVDEAAGQLLRVVREVRPQVMISYDDNGFYGHPDHIQAHRVAWRAFERAGGQVRKLGRDDLAKLAQSAGNQRHRSALGRVFRHRRARPDRLVVRMGVHEQEPAAVVGCAHTGSLTTGQAAARRRRYRRARRLPRRLAGRI